MKKFFLFIIRAYQHNCFLFLLTQGSCRFSPTCSEYCYQAIESHGTIRGSWACIKRITKCNPFFRSGAPPV